MLFFRKHYRSSLMAILMVLLVVGVMESDARES
jgi:hypothetical protein